VTGRVVVPFEWEEIGEFDDHGMAVAVGSRDFIHVQSAKLNDIVMTSESADVIDRRGRIIIPPVRNDRANQFDNHDQFVANCNGRLVVYDRRGRQLMNADWEPLADLAFDSHGLLAARQENDIGWINRDGVLKVRAPEGLTPVSNFQTNGLAVVEDSLERQGCVDLMGRIVIDAEWTDIDADGSWY